MIYNVAISASVLITLFFDYKVIRNMKKDYSIYFLLNYLFLGTPLTLIYHKFYIVNNNINILIIYWILCMVSINAHMILFLMKNKCKTSPNNFAVISFTVICLIFPSLLKKIGLIFIIGEFVFAIIFIAVPLYFLINFLYIRFRKKRKFQIVFTI